MVHSVLESRLERLESQVQELRSELQAVKGVGKDWRRTIGIFTDDAGMKSVFQAALKLREADRKKARSRTARKRRESK
jgi:hypothetical protein